VNRYIVIFIIFSVFGWVWESVYCTARERKWANRGFLFGPLCPIYGCGTLIGLAVYDLAGAGTLPELNAWQSFAAGFLVSMVLEYPTSWALEKLFHARWWDYSRVPLNINGRTSVPTSLAFGLASILLMKVLLPWADGLLSRLPPALMNALALLTVAELSADVTLTASSLTDFQKRVAEVEAGFQEHMTDLVARLYEGKAPVRLGAARRVAVFKLPGRRTDIARLLKEQRWEELRERLRK